jgi:hypothetical protein
MIQQDLKIIEGIGARLDQPMLETLMYIQDNTDEFTLAELRSFYRVMADFRRLLAPAI